MAVSGLTCVVPAILTRSRVLEQRVPHFDAQAGTINLLTEERSAPHSTALYRAKPCSRKICSGADTDAKSTIKTETTCKKQSPSNSSEHFGQGGRDHAQNICGTKHKSSRSTRIYISVAPSSQSWCWLRSQLPLPQNSASSKIAGYDQASSFQPRERTRSIPQSLCTTFRPVP